MKVLIADPDWRFLQQATRFLESRAHLVVHEPRPGAILAHVKHWRPDLVIVAAELAQDGLLESLNDLSDRPALLLTGWLDRYDLAWRAWQGGGDELLIKPVLCSANMHTAIVTAMENAAVGERKVRRAVPA